MQQWVKFLNDEEYYEMEFIRDMEKMLTLDEDQTLNFLVATNQAELHGHFEKKAMKLGPLGQRNS